MIPKYIFQKARNVIVQLRLEGTVCANTIPQPLSFLSWGKHYAKNTIMGTTMILSWKNKRLHGGKVNAKTQKKCTVVAHVQLALKYFSHLQIKQKGSFPHITLPLVGYATFPVRTISWGYSPSKPTSRISISLQNNSNVPHLSSTLFLSKHVYNYVCGDQGYNYYFHFSEAGSNRG